MKNILQYVQHYGHFAFEEKALTDVDALIFAELSYLDFQGLVPFHVSEGGQTLDHIIDRLIEKNTIPFSGIMDTSYRKLPYLLRAIKGSRRYGNLLVCGYENWVVEKEASQFSAVVFSLTDDGHFIAFRGTDSTLVGWQEDAALSFQKRIPSQAKAMHYLFQAAMALRGKLWLGGHSKGGHLAVYAGSFSKEMIRSRIESIYAFDAPGLHREDVLERGYARMLPKVKSFVPHESVIGMLLETPPNSVIVKSSQVGLMQHDAFSWKVEDDHFFVVPHLTKEALDFQQDIRQWLLDLTDEQREAFFELLFKILMNGQAKTLRDLSRQFPFSVVSILQGYSHLTPEEKEKFKKPIATFFAGGQLMRKVSLLAHLYPRILKEK